MTFKNVIADNVVIICRSKEESDLCREMFYAHNIPWRSGKTALEVDPWHYNNSIIYYCIHQSITSCDTYYIGFASDEVFLHANVQFVEFSDLFDIKGYEKECDPLLLMEVLTYESKASGS